MAYVRTQRLEIRLSPLEKASWHSRAREQGLELAEWIRLTLNDKAGFDHAKERQLAEANGAADKMSAESVPEPEEVVMSADIVSAEPKKRVLCAACKQFQWVWGKPSEGCKECKWV